MKHKIAKCEGILESLDNYDKQQDRILKTLQSDVQTKALVSDVRRCVLRQHYEEAISSLGNTVDSKASIGDVLKIDRRVEVG